MAERTSEQKRGALIDGLLDRIHWQVDADVRREDVAELIDSLDEYEMAFVSIPQWTTATEAQRAIDAFYRGNVDARLIDAARAVVDGRQSTYKAKNGRNVSIEADDGEKVYLVHSDLMFELQCAYEAMAGKRRADPNAIVQLVIAAREAWEKDGASGDDLDKALEKFAAIVPYENEPEAAHDD